MQNNRNTSPELTLSRALSGDTVIASYHHAEITLAVFEAKITAWQKTLSVLPRDQFVLFLSDSLEFSAALIAAMRLGKIAHLPSNTLPATCEALKSSGLDIFVGDFENADITRAENINVSDNEKNTVTLTVPGDAEFVLYTSGSTGPAQPVPKRIAQIVRETRSLEQLFAPVVGNARIASTVSHQHIYGLLFKVFWTLSSGRTMVVLPLNFPEELLAVTSRHRVALISGPAHLKRFCDSPLWGKSPFDVNVVFSSGGALDRETALKIKTLTKNAPIEIYGSSETGGIAYRQQSEEGNAAWQPMPEVEWEAGEDGVLRVRSPYLYDDQWLSMSDRVEAIDSQHFILSGRVDRVIKLEEKKIALDAIEKVLRATELIDNARVIPVEMDHHKRISLAAFVILNDHGKTLLAQRGKLFLNRLLRDKLAGSFERIALPKMWRYLDTLPINTQGKTTYADLKALLRDTQKPRVTMPICQTLTQTPRQCVLRLTVPADLIYFDGHFDRIPILPGVTQVDWAIRLGRCYLNLPHTFGGIRQLKFQNIIKPNTTLDLDLSFDSEKSILMFRYFFGDTVYASGQILISSPIS